MKSKSNHLVRQSDDVVSGGQKFGMLMNKNTNEGEK